LVDLDGDGHVDLISGSWPGEIFVFKGGPGRTFGPPEMLKDKDGHVINVGGGVVHEQDDGSVLITGHAKFEETKDGTFVTYHGRRFKSTPDKPVLVTGCASAVHAADWDGDGVLDLLVGDIRGHVYLIPNEGTRQKYAFGKPRQLEAGGKPITVPGGDAGPFVADWDGDGKPDLLVGAGDGSVWFYRNVGTRKEPKLAAGEMLVGPGSITYGPDAPKEPRRGVRAKICVVDWDGDGRPDLLVGDVATQKPDRPEPTPAERAEQEKVRKELEAVRARYSELVQKIIGPSRVKTEDGAKQVRKDLDELRQKMQTLQAKIPPEYEMHGWVWLFRRQPADANGGGAK
jgi:hypothetical protein